MATKIYLPRLGESIEEATIGCYMKKVGQSVQRGDVIAELETAKAMIELESPVKGILLAVFPEEGETIKSGTLVAIVGKADEDWQSELDEKKDKKERQNKKKAKQGQQQTNKQKEKTSQSRIKISPNAKRIARSRGVDLSKLAIKFPGKRITAQDVEKYLAQIDGDLVMDIPTRKEKLTKMQSMTAKLMMESAKDIPQFSVSLEVNVDSLVKKKEKNKAAGNPITMTAFIIKVVAQALRDHPRLNAFYQDNHTIVYEDINLAIAIATQEGLVAPVIHQADTLTIKNISEQLTILKQKTKAHQLLIKDIEKATFTISNLGMMGVRGFVPMVVPFQAAILGVGAVHSTIALKANQKPIQQKHVLFTISADHRLIGGAEVAGFLQTLNNIIKQ